MNWPPPNELAAGVLRAPQAAEEKKLHRHFGAGANERKTRHLRSLRGH